MKILKVAVGNSTEAFVENGFSDKLNIISSDDNNKGKTIVVPNFAQIFHHDRTRRLSNENYNEQPHTNNPTLSKRTTNTQNPHRHSPQQALFAVNSKEIVFLYMTKFLQSKIFQ